MLKTSLASKCGVVYDVLNGLVESITTVYCTSFAGISHVSYIENIDIKYVFC